MRFDDRLATVLRHRATGARAARTQFRQLLDLLDRPREARDSRQIAAAWLRLGALGGIVPASKRAAMVADPSTRLRNPELVAHLAEDEPDVAAAALTKAELAKEDWEALIPRLPIRARGFLRLRRDLPDSARELLERLGVHDRGLPQPETAAAPAEAETAAPEPAAAAPANPAPVEDTQIGALVRRIEEFRHARSAAGERDAPRLPLGDGAADADRPTRARFAFTADSEGRIDWAEPAVAPALIGKRLTGDAPDIARDIALRQPIVQRKATLAGAPAIAGQWVVDASPRFGSADGRFHGYAGRFRRAVETSDSEATAVASPESDRIRQLLHELRTPVNAIQGFAEVIQQQLFGAVPHEYRAHAATIAGDAARILAGFDELDRLAKLESGAIELDDGTCDFAAIVQRITGQLEEVLGSRMAGFDADVAGEAAPVPLAQDEAEALAWRLLASIAGATGAGEQLALSLDRSGREMVLSVDLPARLAAEDDIFVATAQAPGSALSAGSFGAGFSLRLARAEAQAAGGSLARVDDCALLVLPLLTGGEAVSSPAGNDNSGNGAAQRG